MALKGLLRPFRLPSPQALLEALSFDLHSAHCAGQRDRQRIPQPTTARTDGRGRHRSLQSRLSFDGLAIMLAVALGYTCFVYVSVTEGRRYARVHGEIELATEIHRVLVPSIDTKLGGFEFYSASAPSGEVGGDLIDLAGSDEAWVAYVADVSGHGVAPGLVIKSAARMLLSSGAGSANLMARLNEVLYPLKKPDMFVTFCYLPREAGVSRVGLAGHPPVLHLSAATNLVPPCDAPTALGDSPLRRVS